MANQTFQLGAQPHCTITGGRGDLQIEVGDGRIMSVESEAHVTIGRQPDEAPIINGYEGSLRLRLPHDATVRVSDHEGAILIRGIAQVIVETAVGDVMIEQIGEAVTLRDLTGDLRVTDCPALVLQDGERSYRPGEQRGVENVSIDNVVRVSVENVGRDLSLNRAEQANVGNIGGRCLIADIAGDLRVANIGTTASLRAIAGNADLDNVGGACNIERVDGVLRVGNIGGSATLTEIGAVERLGNVGGALHMNRAELRVAAMPRPLHIAVGGSASIELADGADVTIQAMVGGHISGTGLALSGPGMHRIVYGEGSAQLHLIAGGNIELRGGGAPQSTGSSWGRWARSGANPGHTVAATIADRHQPVENTHEVGRRSPEDERRAILQMVAEGRINPGDADALLEAL